MLSRLKELLAFAVECKASDLHLSEGMPPICRVDGNVRELDAPPVDPIFFDQMLEALFSVEQRNYLATHKELDASFELDEPVSARFRINAFHHTRGRALAFRVIPTRIPTLEDLGLGEMFRKIASLPHGLVLVTGATGSGKSTTLAAMVDFLNRSRRHHILTIEDPVEFVHRSQCSLVHQREVGPNTGSFANALRAALREDPDVILIGEMRDLETIRLALTAAETGHLVLATVHTSSAAKTINRIIDVFPGDEKGVARSILSESLRAVISQTLIPREEGGRVLAQEIMIGTPVIRNLIREDKISQLHVAIQTGLSDGMKTLDQSLKLLFQRGQISRETACCYATSEEKI